MLIHEDAEIKRARILKHYKDHHHLIHDLILLIDIKFHIWDCAHDASLQLSIKSKMLSLHNFDVLPARQVVTTTPQKAWHKQFVMKVVTTGRLKGRTIRNNEGKS